MLISQTGAHPVHGQQHWGGGLRLPRAEVRFDPGTSLQGVGGESIELMGPGKAFSKETGCEEAHISRLDGQRTRRLFQVWGSSRPEGVKMTWQWSKVGRILQID